MVKFESLERKKSVQYLLVIDMQEDYVGEKRDTKRYAYDTKKLISGINQRILQYPPESVIYITNKFFWEVGSTSKMLVNGLNIVSSNVYMKKKSSALSNVMLLQYLRKMNITSLELVGIDGNYCVANTALEGVKKGFSILCNECCIGASDKTKFERTKLALSKRGVQFI